MWAQRSVSGSIVHSLAWMEMPLTIGLALCCVHVAHANSRAALAGCFLGSVAGPVTCDVLDVIENIEDCEWAPKEGGPPHVWEWEQPWYAMSGAICSWGEEYFIATAKGWFCGGGAGVGSEEVGPAVCGAKGWVL